MGLLPDEDKGVGIVLHALEKGVRYIDTAPSYSRGRSERRVGKAVRRWADAEHKREDLFIATKTLERSASGARRELEESLKRLDMEYVDSVQCHEVHDDYESLFAKGGVIEALEQARDEGLVRHISITGHRNPKWLIESVKRYEFATALVPVNPIDVQHLSFVRDFLPVAVERNVAVIAMKIYGGGFLLSQTDDDGKRVYSAADLLTYALSHQGVSIVVPGCDELWHLDEAFDAVSTFKNPGPEQLAAFEARAGSHEGKSTEWYKDEK